MRIGRDTMCVAVVLHVVLKDNNAEPIGVVIPALRIHLAAAATERRVSKRIGKAGQKR